MKKRIRAVFRLSAALALFGVCAASRADSAGRPNIIVILADDMGFDSVSAHNEKIGVMKTPCIDRLMSQGMRFSDAHSGSAVCTPTRYGLLTGRYCWRSRLKNEVLWEWGRPLIEKGRLTIAGLLRRQGYATSMVGKWHLGMDWYDSEGKIANADLDIHDCFYKKGQGAERTLAVRRRVDLSKRITGGPVDNGFDYYFGVDVPNFPPYAWIENDRVLGNPSINKPRGMFGIPGPMVPGWKFEEILPGLARKADEWITKQGKSGKPFFLYMSLTSPHSPIAPSPAFRGKSGVSDYADFVMETDWAVGRIMETLEREKLCNDTLLIFTTDNGTSPEADFRRLEAHGIDLHNHFSGHKGMIQEGGHRIPLAARWPGRIKPGSVCGQTVCLTDLMATAADLLGCKLPDDAGEDSTSILPLLLGQKESLPGHPPVIHHDYAGNFSIRDGKWKLLAAGGKLYDMGNDVKERRNIAAQHPEIVKKLSAALEKYRAEGRSRPPAQGGGGVR